MAILTQGCVGCLHCSITKHRFIWRENWKLSLSITMPETLAWPEQTRVDDRTDHKLGIHTEHVWVLFWNFQSLDCNIIRAWSESTTGNGLKRRYYGYNWKNVNIWWTAARCAWKNKNHNWANCSQSDFLLREHNTAQLDRLEYDLFWFAPHPKSVTWEDDWILRGYM